MRKIADADELEHELRRLLAVSQGEQPSRSRIAAELSDLSFRLAGTRLANKGETILQAKINWAMELAELMAARFSGAGGWRDQYIKTSIHRTYSGCTVNLESQLGWNCAIDINVEGTGQIDLSFYVESKSPRDALPDPDDLDLSGLLGMNKSSRSSFPIKDREPMAKTMMDVSLWISKQLPH